MGEVNALEVIQRGEITLDFQRGKEDVTPPVLLKVQEAQEIRRS